MFLFDSSKNQKKLISTQDVRNSVKHKSLMSERQKDIAKPKILKNLNLREIN